MRNRIVESKYNPFNTSNRAAVFGAGLGFGLGYLGGETVNFVNDIAINYEHEIPPLLPAAVGAITVGIAYGRIGRAFEKSEIPAQEK